MTTRKFFIIIIMLIGLGLAFMLAKPATAEQPVFVDCPIYWLDSNYDMIEFITEGRLVSTAQGFNLTCNYEIDFTDPGIASLADVCAIWGGCVPSGQNIVIQNTFYWGIFFDESLEIFDNKLIVQPDGSVMLKIQYAPEQCSSEVRGYDYTMEFPAGFWEEGVHVYTITEILPYDPDPFSESFTQVFTVTETAPLLHTHVRLGAFNQLPVNEINPNQETFMQYSLHWPMEYTWLTEFYHGFAIITFDWDGGDAVQIQPGPIRNGCGLWLPGAFQRNYGYAR